MSSLPPSLTKNGVSPEQEKEKSPAEVCASGKAEKMVADIMSSFREGTIKKDEVAGIGRGVGGLGTGDDVGPTKEAEVEDEENGKKGVHSSIQGCEDCR